MNLLIRQFQNYTSKRIKNVNGSINSQRLLLQAGSAGQVEDTQVDGQVVVIVMEEALARDGNLEGVGNLQSGVVDGNLAAGPVEVIIHLNTSLYFCIYLKHERAYRSLCLPQSD